MKARKFTVPGIAVLFLSAGLLGACASPAQPAAVIEEAAESGEPSLSAATEIVATETAEPPVTPTAVAVEKLPQAETDVQEDGEDMTASFQLTSPAFNDGADIPSKYTCSGEDVSPHLAWSGVPQGTISFALICNDPDAPVGNWIHWVIYNIPAGLTELPENVAKSETVPDTGVQGVNDSRKTGYNGPCPPPGSPHRYYFTLYALDEETQFQPGLKAGQLYDAIDGHVLAETQWMGTFQR